MRRFELLEPATLPEAARLLADLGDEGKVIAGGTTLLILIKQGIYIPQKLINLKKV
ncbi:MAG: FAD binding domain-containing protein, partial [Chloroflexi bacterium]|nr:FAD binding domain-containing protein [Chloroflexota bacterium]